MSERITSVADLVRHLDDSDIESHTVVGIADRLWMDVPLAAGMGRLRIRFDERVIDFAVHLPFGVPDEQADAVCRVLCEANHGLVVPGFHLDPLTRAIGYRFVVPRDPLGLDPKIATILIHTAIDTAFQASHHLASLSPEGVVPTGAIPAPSSAWSLADTPVTPPSMQDDGAPLDAPRPPEP